jgi:hypothetical protein
VGFIAVCLLVTFVVTRKARRQSRPFVALACWSVIALGFGLIAAGAINSLYFEPTVSALHRASIGHWMLFIGAIVAVGGGLGERRRRKGRDSREAQN